MNDKQVRFGIIGTNFITDTVINDGRQDERFVVTAVCSRTRERAEEYASKQHIPHVFTSQEEMAKSPLIDAVYIASPNAFHARQTKLFLEHGKHVLCEKPLASNVREAREMIEVARKNQVVLMEAMKPTLTPAFGAIRTNLSSIGTIRRYFSSYCQYSSRYDKLKEGIVLNAFKPELSNGAMMDIGIYTIYPMVVLFGRPQKIIASGMLLSTGVDGQGTVTCQYDGFDATILYSKIADSALPTEIQGEEGIILCDRINLIGHVELKPRKGELQDITPVKEHDEYFYEVKEFIDLILSGKQESLVNSHENSLITLEIIDEVRRQLGVIYPADLN